MHRNSVTTLLSTILLAGSCVAGPAAAQQVAGERSRTPEAAPVQWKTQRYPDAQVARLAYRALPAERLQALERARGANRIKAEPIGVARKAATETSVRALPALRWAVLGKSGNVARVVVSSPDARALRVGLALSSLHDRDELRFAGSADPARVVAVLYGWQVKRQLDAQGLFWTPNTDGDTQTIELFRPAGTGQALPKVRAPALSHLVADSRSGFKLAPIPGRSGACNVDTVCRVAELGPRYVEAKNAVAHMQFVRGGTTYICTGTLLNDVATESQIPWFYGANHCFTDNSAVAPVASQMQSVANTLNTFWNYEATSCGSGTSTAGIQLAGGSDYLYSDHVTDAMLLRLRNAAPVGAFFSGWNAGALGAPATIYGIHHPSGDLKKVSSGQTVGSSDSMHSVGWLSGTTEGGSSGSALFTNGSAGYELRGGLYGGSASCANTGSISNTENRDVYSRFDVVYPSLRAYLENGPAPRNGSQPLLRPRTTAGASAVPVSEESPRESSPAAPRRAAGVPDSRRRVREH